MNALEDFLATLHTNPTARIKLHEFCTLFRAKLAPVDQKQWPRKRIVAELGTLFPVGRDTAGVLHVGGLSLTPPSRLVAENGRLVLKATDAA